ncbi:MAG: S1 RNA-binding domain-containing protein, partial [Candidatus Kerfeldbacteria bacterium]|nr:S1 RNA-binding domain-containing protein [Candidatus Kerfeldbacteria bacterium]
IEDGGIVHVTSSDAEQMKRALEMVDLVTKDVEVGEIYDGKVTQIVKGRDGGGEIGALVEVLPGKVGMVHISALEWHRVEKVTDILNVGDVVKVKVMSVDRDKDRIELSRKELLPPPPGGIPPRDMTRDDRPRRGGFGGGRLGRPFGRGPRPLPRRHVE